MKKIILIGNIGCGKTTLSQRLTGQELSYKKTQAIEVIDNTILDTPGEFLEVVKLRGALMITSSDADVIVLLQSAIDDMNMYSPGYAGSFAKEVIGVVTKIDVATEEEIKMADEDLKMAGASKIFHISSYTGQGIEDLENYLNS